MNLTEEIRIQAENINFYYGEKQTLKNVSMAIFKNRVTAIIGPSG
ncbi:MAG: phosphate ABC transporter ATP-binding protein, partial [Candidatus Marinimicrobia bacterium]|nr:phosphate ABC transporter ATP-binding protein [Candidatus Neomarinimicrobiota bacterium]